MQNFLNFFRILWAMIAGVVPKKWRDIIDVAIQIGNLIKQAAEGKIVASIAALIPKGTAQDIFDKAARAILEFMRTSGFVPANILASNNEAQIIQYFFAGLKALSPELRNGIYLKAASYFTRFLLNNGLKESEADTFVQARYRRLKDKTA